MATLLKQVEVMNTIIELKRYRFELYPGVRLQKSSAVDFQQIGLR